jgi:hypothetical protein
MTGLRVRVEQWPVSLRQEFVETWNVYISPLSGFRMYVRSDVDKEGGGYWGRMIYRIRVRPRNIREHYRNDGTVEYSYRLW